MAGLKVAYDFVALLQLENIRRKHNYLPLIMEVLKILAKRGELVGLVEKARASPPNSENFGSFYLLSLRFNDAIY